MNESNPSGAHLTQIQQAVADHFREGGSITAIFLVLLVMVVVIVAIAIFNHYQQQSHTHSPLLGDPQTLFAGLMRDLALPVAHRELLAHVAKDLQMPHPAILLMSFRYYDASMTRWVRNANLPTEALTATQRSMMEVRTQLFPHG